uniref:Uncharacterized protein n=1 Tax=Riptortus pedestris TaxID=329032 RepID=R4WI16_RIPPE|nr:unknown secreted protein [Riptortus pedestris]
MHVLGYTLFGFLLVQAILGSKFKKETNHIETFAIPATPALDINSGLEADPPFSTPSIPAIKLTPEEEQELKQYVKFGKIGYDQKFGFSIPAIPALRVLPEEYQALDNSFPTRHGSFSPKIKASNIGAYNERDFAFSFPALPAMELTPDEINKLQNHYGELKKFKGDRSATYSTSANPDRDVNANTQNVGEKEHFAIPAIPALSIPPEELQVLSSAQFESDNVFSIPAIPALRVSPEESQLLSEAQFENNGVFSIPAIPALRITPEELQLLSEAQFENNDAFSVPAIPALRITPEESQLLSEAQLENNDAFSIPAIPARRITPEESQHLSDAQFKQDHFFSIPVIPALKVSAEEQVLLNKAQSELSDAILSTPAWNTYTQASTLGSDEPFAIPAIPAMQMTEEELHLLNIAQFPYNDNVRAMPNYFIDTYSLDENEPFAIPAIPALTLGEEPENEDSGIYLGADTKRCMNMILSLQKIPRMIRFTFDASINVTHIGLPLLKQILECSKGDFMETMVCLGEKEAEIKDFVLLFDKQMKPHVVALHEQLLATREELFACLQINQPNHALSKFL